MSKDVAGRGDAVLVLDGDMVPALTIARSLGRLGLRIVVAAHEAKPLAGYSRHVERTLTYPDPLTEEQAFLGWCKQVIAEQDYDLIVPVTERTVVPMAALASLPGGDRIAVAAAESLNIALDKNKTIQLAKQLGIPTPKTVYVEGHEQLRAGIGPLQFPVVIKPSHSIGENDSHRMQLRVEYAFDETDLENKLQHYFRYGPVLLQEYVLGEGVGIELIAAHGNTVFSFQHRRLHEMPLTGGGSSLRVSEAVAPELLRASKSLMKAMSWHGVAMVEFKWNPINRRFALMEINGRFWGSLPLAVAAGADFPAMLYELYRHGRVAPRLEAKPGVYCRKLSSDLYWHELVFRREAPAQLVRFPTGREMFRDWLRIFSWNHNFDVQQWRDIRPGLVDLQRIVSRQFSRAVNLVNDRRAAARERQAWRKGTVDELLRDAGQVLFVCYGNINRSALAESYFRKRVPAERVEAVSAGFHQVEGRPADPVMVDVAASRGLDLGASLSRTLNDQMVHGSDVIFVMELKHKQQLCERYPEACGKTFLLNAGASQQDSAVEIADPYGQPREVYEACAELVVASVDRLAASL